MLEDLEVFRSSHNLQQVNFSKNQILFYFNKIIMSLITYIS